MINKMLHKFFSGRAFSKKDLTDLTDLTDLIVTDKTLLYTKSKKREIRVIYSIFNES